MPSKAFEAVIWIISDIDSFGSVRSTRTVILKSRDFKLLNNVRPSTDIPDRSNAITFLSLYVCSIFPERDRCTKKGIMCDASNLILDASRVGLSLPNNLQSQ